MVQYRLTMIAVKRIYKYSENLAVELGKLLTSLSEKMTGNPVHKESVERILASNCHELFVAYDGDNIVGASVLSLVMGIDENFKNGPNAYLESFVVDSNCQGKGVGQKIWNEMLTWCKEKGVNKLEFTSNAKRHSAHEFYRKNGATIYDTCFFQLSFSNK